MSDFFLRHTLSSETSRREFVTESFRRAAALVALGALPARRDDTAWTSRSYPFTLGVASGDPAPGGFVAWTRLAPDPILGGGMPARPVPVRFEIAADESFRRIVQRGDARALPELAHSVHVEVAGLSPAREYFYRFMAGGEVSPIGRAVTAPALGATNSELRFAFVSCQHYEFGYYTAYHHVAADNVDLIVHLGDYIYENGIGDAANSVRQHDGDEIVTLQQYRNRLALYKTDRDLQNAHASAPFVVTWDDHEVDNNYAGAISEKNDPQGFFLARRAAAYQAFYEHLPLRRTSVPSGPALQLYRRIPVGSLATFHVLDERQYRSDQPCGDGRKPRCAEASDPSRTMLGADQERWLLDGLGRSGARWNFIANQVVMGDNMIRRPEDADDTYPLDTWNGYVAQRQRILEAFAARKAANPVVLTGDIHVSIAMDLRAEWANPAAPTVAVELVGTSISSGGDGRQLTDIGRLVLASNPHMKFFDGRRGYVRVTANRERLTADFRVVPYVTRFGAPAETSATFVVENGVPRLQRA